MAYSAGKQTRLLLIGEEIDGDRHGTSDFVFCRIGNPISLQPAHSDPAFDLQNPPNQPLAVSDTHGLLFLAHSEGFLVANTKDVIGLAMGVNGEDACVQRLCVMDVKIGRISILALSGDNSMLAATVGGEIHMFFVQSLMGKVQEPAISRVLDKSGIVKDLKWQRSSQNSFLILWSNGLLCHGSSDLLLDELMNDADAVDWSVDGNFIAIARKDTVSILSSDFEEKLSIPLLFQSWASDPTSEIKVDSIKWVRHDSIVLGCSLLKEDEDEDGYFVQVIHSGEHRFTEVLCNPVVFSFSDLFEGLSASMLPTGVGPYLLMEYLDCWDVAISSHKKNIDQHICLLRWIAEDNKYEVVSLELGSDKYIPRIDLQDDGDDNLILGLAIDKNSLHEKINIQCDMELKEIMPRYVIFCLTCDGKITLYHAAWISEPSDLPKIAFPRKGNTLNEKAFTIKLTDNEFGADTARLKDGADTSRLKDDLNATILDIAANEGNKMETHGTSESPEPFPQRTGMVTTNSSRRLSLEKPKMLSCVEDLSNKPVSDEITSNSLKSSKGLSFNVNERSSSSSLNVAQFSEDKVVAEHLSPLCESNYTGIGNKAPFSPMKVTSAKLPTLGKSFGSLATSEKELTSILHSGSAAASATPPGSRKQFLFDNSSSSKLRQKLESEPQFSKQFYDVKDMTKELDALLSSIECEGGFKDLCTVFQEQSLLELEAGLKDFSEALFAYKEKIENQRVEIRELCNKMVEVSARQVYIKGVVQQASDRRYWAIWNNQKLGPEFEKRRQHILNLKQNMANQLIELERHFNNLEINRFIECDAVATSRRAPSNSAYSRQNQSLHSIHNTVNSQLAAAEHLSESLSQQMAALNIRAPTSEKRNIAKELFESIGLDPNADAFLCSDPKTCKADSYSLKRPSFSSSISTECDSNDAKKIQRTARRKLNSLDKSWAHFEPPRTTVKRSSKKGPLRSNADVAFKDAKSIFDSQLKAFDVARKASSDSSGSPAQPITIAKRSAKGLASPPLTSTYSSNSQSPQHSPSKGIQEKSPKKAAIFKWAKNSSELLPEVNASLSSPSSLSAASTHSSSFGIKMPFAPKPSPLPASIQVKFSGNVSPVKPAFPIERTIQSNSTISTETSIQNSTAASNSSFAPKEQPAFSPASSFQFAKSLPESVFSSPSALTPPEPSLRPPISLPSNKNSTHGPAKALSPLASKTTSDLSTDSKAVLLSPIGASDINTNLQHIQKEDLVASMPLDTSLSPEDEMEEEAADANSMLNFDSLSSFSTQFSAPPGAQKPNPFGSPFSTASTASITPALSWNASQGQFFRPPSFNLPVSISPQSSPSPGSSSLTGLSGVVSGFGQPAQLGAGQHALGSALGSFGQSSQIGTATPGFGFAAASGSSGGLGTARGFAGAAAGGGGGFAGFGGGGGFAGASAPTTGFSTGGFADFSGGIRGGFSAFSSGNSSAGRPPAELLMQIRK